MHAQDRVSGSARLKMMITTALTTTLSTLPTTAFWRRAVPWSLMGALWAPVLFAAASDAASNAATPPEISTAKEGPERLRLIDLAISHCLGQAFPDTPFAADAGRAAAAYVELGESDVEVYNEIGQVVERHMQSPYASKSGRSLHVLQCLDLSRSAELARVIEKHAK